MLVTRRGRRRNWRAECGGPLRSDAWIPTPSPEKNFVLALCAAFGIVLPRDQLRRPTRKLVAGTGPQVGERDYEEDRRPIACFWCCEAIGFPRFSLESGDGGAPYFGARVVSPQRAPDRPTRKEAIVQIEQKQEVRVHIRWMIRRDMPEVLAIEAARVRVPLARRRLHPLPAAAQLHRHGCRI